VDWETPTGKAAPVHIELQLSAHFGYGKAEEDCYLGLQAHGVLWAASLADAPTNWPIAPPIVSGKVRARMRACRPGLIAACMRSLSAACQVEAFRAFCMLPACMHHLRQLCSLGLQDMCHLLAACFLAERAVSWTLVGWREAQLGHDSRQRCMMRQRQWFLFLPCR
jgi:hypothetical protein